MFSGATGKQIFVFKMTHKSIYVYIYIYMYSFFIHSYIYIYIYIYTYIQTFFWIIQYIGIFQSSRNFKKEKGFYILFCFVYYIYTYTCRSFEPVRSNQCIRTFLVRTLSVHSFRSSSFGNLKKRGAEVLRHCC